jgi:Rod binding domain-containing protein
MPGILLPPAASLPPEAAGLAPAEIAKAWKAAEDFEAMALGSFLDPIFKTADASNEAFGGGVGESTWKPMLVTAMAKEIAAAGGLGLARPVFAEMLRMQESVNRSAASSPAPRATRKTEHTP